MDLTVVIPTLNARDRLLETVESFAALTGPLEVVVVNGPSADGTSGAVREHGRVDVLVEIAERNRNVARNAGIAVARGDMIAFLGDDCRVGEGWREAIATARENGAAAVTGPVQADRPRRSTRSDVVDGRPVARLCGNNMAIRRSTLSELDGFDERLVRGGARDCAHRLAGADYTVTWTPDMTVRRTAFSGGPTTPDDWRERYQTLTYRLIKNYGLRPGVAVAIVRRMVNDGTSAAGNVVGGSETPTGWWSNGRSVFAGVGGGVRDGLFARITDRTPRRNPAGLSARHDRAVTLHDRRSVTDQPK